jgi:hypothetical protein
MTTYTLNEDKMFADITDGIAIIINSQTGIYYGMNEFSTSIFEKLISGCSDEEILTALKTLPNVPEDIAKKLNAFISDLTTKELILETQSKPHETCSFSPELNTDGFELNCDEYSDAQEMLMADPIHEVKEELGWSPEKESIGYSKEETLEREQKMQQDA